jgi:hypothetical protein
LKNLSSKKIVEVTMMKQENLTEQAETDDEDSFFIPVGGDVRSTRCALLQLMRTRTSLGHNREDQSRQILIPSQWQHFE